MTSPELELVWDGGSLDLMGSNTTDYGDVLFQTVAEGTEWGKPESVRRALFSALADGSASVTDRHDNRTVVVKLRLTAADSAALAGGEAPLHMLASMRRAELRWTPPNDFAAPAVFVIVASDLAHNMDDLGENRCQRQYTLTLTCLPFALSVDPVEIDAPPAFVAAPSVLDACTSTTGWVSLGGMTFAVVSGAVEVTGAAGVQGYIYRSGTLVRTKRYLALETDNVSGRIAWSPPPTYARLTVHTTSGSAAPPMVGISGTWRFFDLIDVPAGNITQITFPLIESSPTGGVLVQIKTIAESDAPAFAAGHQSLREIPTPGSARAPGTLVIESRDGVESLEEVIAYTGPQYDPRLSIGRVESDALNDDAYSGSLAMNRTVFTFYREAADFPSGTYVLWANPATAAARTWTIATSIVDAAGTALTASQSHQVSFPAASSGMVPMGFLDLPGAALPTMTPHRIKFVFTASATVASWDEGLLFHMGGNLSILTASGASKVWLESGGLDHGPRVLRGTTDHDSAVPVSLATELKSWSGSHHLLPAMTYLYTGTSGTEDPAVSVEDFRPAWHTHPAA